MARMRDTVVQLVDHSRTAQTSFANLCLADLRTVVVGAGALGNEVAKALGLLGCGEVLIVDPDTIESHNLTRSVLFRTESAVGEGKAVSLAEACRHYFPDTVWTASTTEIGDTGSAYLAKSDIIFSCVDNELARLEIAYLGTKFDIPVCDAGLGRESYLKARVSFFPGRRFASFCCLLPPSRRRELLTIWECQSYPCWAGGDAPTASPGTPTAAAIGGSMQVETGLRMLFDLRCGLPAGAESLELELGPEPRLARFRVPLSVTCPFHEEVSVNSVIQPAGSGGTVRQLLSSVVPRDSGNPMLVLDWPICVLARCRICGGSWRPMKRLSSLRRSVVCPECGSKELMIERSIYRIGYDSDLLDHRLGELGLPDRNLYTVQFLPGDGQ
jgi:adenylyltransferase/sulfurtransferase